MPLGLYAKITVDPDSVLSSRWSHDIANAFCRAKLRAEVEFLIRAQARLRYSQAARA